MYVTNLKLIIILLIGGILGIVCAYSWLSKIIYYELLKIQKRRKLWGDVDPYLDTLINDFNIKPYYLYECYKYIGENDQ